MSQWSVNKSAELYGINLWGAQFFSANESGNVSVSPLGPKGPSIDLHSLTEELVERGIRLPLLIRFSDIIKSRVELISNCFAHAIEEYEYSAKYQGVYPIKVNQQRHLVEEIVKYGRDHQLGLECGSKPELLICLAMMENPGAFIVCNGFKDSEYIETALLSQKLGHNTFVVVDRREELDLIIAASRKLKIQPKIGLRSKLNTQGAGKWVESSGAHSKFGLTPSEIVSCVEQLTNENMLDCLELLHFHIGSQIPSIQSIKGSIKEGARFYTELKCMAPSLSYIDVGGGLGVDYDGSGASDSSTNYNEQEYANDVVTILKQICDEKSIAHPNIITESGRALIAHSSVLIFDILGENKIAKGDIQFDVSASDSPLVRDMYDIYINLELSDLNEDYNDLVEKRRDTLQLFTYGVLDLKQRAKAEDLYWATAEKIVKLTQGVEDYEDIFYQLEKELSSTYFCNFSVFQSLPDSWALKQVFPVMPIHRLDEKPEKRAVLVDLTCDSDGKIDRFIDVDENEPQRYLEVHDLKPNQKYLIGAFITGAYQEILGDLHNLFGDTDAVHISTTSSGYQVDHVVEGDSVAEVLSLVEYQKPELIEKIRKSSEIGISEGKLTKQEARLLMKHYELGLAGYTYFEDMEEEPIFT